MQKSNQHIGNNSIVIIQTATATVTVMLVITRTRVKIEGTMLINEYRGSCYRQQGPWYCNDTVIETVTALPSNNGHKNK